MIVLASALLGIIIGVTTAKKRGGNRKDLLHYAAGYGLAFVIVGMFLTVTIDRLAG